MVLGMVRADFRRCFIELALKRVKPGSGSGLALLQRRTWVHTVSDLNQILLPGLFVIVGGVATRMYMPERSTLDLDILISMQETSTVYALLEKASAIRIGELGIPGSQWQLVDGTSLDVLISEADWISTALAQPNYSPDGLPVIALPYLVLMKIQASRAQDLADVSRMLGGAGEEELEKIRQVIQMYFPEALEDVESLIVLGRLEYENS
ncbi:MAG: hypothetical protein HC857_02060 [Synechococcales cyanobacterium RU_4_20]|nr:hypothetical protein [Synechococcales cyanobacterium RU_4_20]NJR68703.1 hypothetical protein [Synechococcales cyanobacterium CRU_2_2]